MSSSAYARIAGFLFLVGVFVLAACTSSNYSSGGCRAPCGCGPSGTYSYGPSGTPTAQPMPLPGQPVPPVAAPTVGPTVVPVAPAAPKTAAEQIERGRAAFGRYCAQCHGPTGGGTDKAPALVGAGALPLDPPPTRQFRKMQFRTAADVGQFVAANMPPPGKGEKPPPDDAWAIVAFAADANGAHPTAVLSPSNASTLVLHP